jgi:hypothetical protein
MIDACHKFLKQWMMFDSRFWDSYYRQHWILRWGVIIMPQVTQCSLFYGIYEGKWKLRELIKMNLIQNMKVIKND